MQRISSLSAKFAIQAVTTDRQQQVRRHLVQGSWSARASLRDKKKFAMGEESVFFLSYRFPM